MWRIGWTARMRRVRPIIDEVVHEEMAVDVLSAGVQRALALTGSSTLQKLATYLFNDASSPLQGPIDAAESAVSDHWLSKYLKNKAREVAGPVNPGKIIH